MEQESPDGGTFAVGETVKLAYVDQSHANIDPENYLAKLFRRARTHHARWEASQFSCLFKSF